MKRFVKGWMPCFENDNDAFVPELWAQESLMVLEANMIAANLVHRDFEPVIAKYGDIVNTRRPSGFTSTRKTDSDDVTTSDASATNVQVPLNQHHHISFIIKDGEASKGFKNLTTEYLVPAMSAIAQAVDEMILCQAYEFLGNATGKLGTAMTKATMLAARETLNVNKVPMAGRNLIVTPSAETDLLSVEELTSAEKVGDDGTSIREAYLGRRLGFNCFMDQNAPSIASGNTTTAGAVNYSAGYDAGTTTLVVNGITGAVVSGTWLTIAGDMTPQMITAHTETTGDTTGITITPGLRNAVVHTAVITMYTAGAINLSAGYASGYAKTLTVNGFSVAPKIGQLMTIGATASTAKYGLMSTPTTTAVLPNRPIEAAAANTTVVGIGPAGNYNLAFHRNAIALVTRPLALPDSPLAMSYVANYNGLSIRVVITYDGKAQGHRVTLDLLCGVKTLDTSLGCVIFS